MESKLISPYEQYIEIQSYNVYKMHMIKRNYGNKIDSKSNNYWCRTKIDRERKDNKEEWIEVEKKGKVRGTGLRQLTKT